MAVDILIILFIGLFGFLGFRTGILFGIPRFISLVIAVFLAFILNGVICDFLKSSTELYDIYSNIITDNTKDFMNHYKDSTLEDIPFGISTLIEKSLSKALIVEKITETSFSILIFILTLIIIKIIFMLIVYKFYKRTTTGFIGGIDGILGLFLGIVKGAVISFLIIIFVFPFSFVITPEFNEFLNNSLGNSIIVNLLISINPLGLLSNNFSLDMLLPGSWNDNQDLVIDPDKNLENLI